MPANMEDAPELSSLCVIGKAGYGGMEVCSAQGTDRIREIKEAPC